MQIIAANNTAIFKQLKNWPGKLFPGFMLLIFQYVPAIGEPVLHQYENGMSIEDYRMIKYL